MHKIASYAVVVAAILLMGFVAFDFQNQGNPLPGICDNPPTAELQILQLPEDGQAYYTTVFVAADYKSHAKSRELVAWFDSDPKLRSLKAQTHFRVVPSNDPIYTHRYTGMVPTVPAVVVQKPDGQKVYHQAGDALPNSPSALAADIQGNLYQAAGRPCPRPDPAPTPAPVVIDGPPQLEPSGPTDAPPVILAGIAALIGLGVGVGTKYYEQYYAASV